MRTVTITAALNGIKVQVGCTELVFNHVEEFITAFRAYVADPHKVEKEWLERYRPNDLQTAANQCGIEPPQPVPTAQYVPASQWIGRPATIGQPT